ncbi:MAG: NAD-dependent epimerase/dehydratase family protein [Acidobacteria bacterium]|jgi:UDP-glucose 4-epimerase|nr:MAG: NAD-dependent epimerase/dehydratase family protein [Acidobacteriota bacterium]GIU81118.1 MAG: epimerase [Pyrinomonadaceae bacterium]
MGRVLVLGGKGFVGSHLIDALLNSRASVRCFDRPDPAKTAEILKWSGLTRDFELCEGDFLNEGDLKNALNGCDVCFHLISTTIPSSSNADPVFDIQTNLAGTVRFLELAVETGVKKIIFMSSGGTVYGIPKIIPINEEHPTEPICSYGITKLAIEKYLNLFHHLYGLDYRVLRVSNLYGERQRIRSSQGAVAVFLGKAIRNETIEIWGNGSVVRDYIYIGDVIDALMKVMNYEGETRIFNIGSGEGKSLNDVISAIEALLGRKVSKKFLAPRKFDVPVNILSIELAKRELGWEPKVGFEEGLRRFANWMLESVFLEEGQ